MDRVLSLKPSRWAAAATADPAFTGPLRDCLWRRADPSSVFEILISGGVSA
jgi:hypothetical protein